MAGKKRPSGLRDIDDRPPEEATEIRRKGAAAANAKKAKKKMMRDDLEVFLSSSIVEGETVQQTITLALIKRAMEGDTKAYEVIRDTIGQKPVDKSQTSLSGSLSFKWSDKEQDA